MQPYPGNHLSAAQENFNKRISSARMTIEDSFGKFSLHIHPLESDDNAVNSFTGILCARFHILNGTIDMQPVKAEKVVLACVVLHNFIKRHYTEPYVDHDLIGTRVRAQEISPSPADPPADDPHAVNSVSCRINRDNLKDHFMSHSRY